jgi:glycosyltransferase involved in cell wall biosynthesis
MARKFRVPFFITEHDFDEIETCATNPARRRFYLDLVPGISGWVCVADRMRDAMNRIFPGIPAITVHNGADRIPNELMTVPRPAAWAARTLILCVGFFYKRKNMPLLIESFDRIAAKHPDALLIVVGDGDEKQAVIAAHEKAKNRAQIVLLGSLGHREVLQHMVWSDFFALIGGDEPFATVFTEAMMAGKPIVFASDGGITDVVTHGVQGLSVTAGNGDSAAAALDKMLSDKGFRERSGLAASKLANEQLTWPQNALNMTRLFEHAIAEAPARF